MARSRESPRRAPPNASELPTREFASNHFAPSHPETDVDSLIAKFAVSEGTEQQHARALRAIAELDPTPAPPANRSGPTEADVEDLLGMRSEHPTAETPQPSPRRARPALRGQERQLPTQPSQLKKTRAPSASTSDNDRRRGWWPVAVLALAAIAAGAYAMWWLRPEATVRHEASPAKLTALAPPAEAPPPCVGALVVTDVPPSAEVLLHEGQAPVDIVRMPVGARLEFVATAEGYAPKRVVVPAGAGWDPGPDGKPRFEAAVQLDSSHARIGTTDPWPAGEPGSAVGGEGPTGTVRVVATPRGAEVWMLAGIGPDARIDHLRCDQDIDVLLAGPTTLRKRLRVQAADFVAEPAASPAAAGRARVARISAK